MSVNINDQMRLFFGANDGESLNDAMRRHYGLAVDENLQDAIAADPDAWYKLGPDAQYAYFQDIGESFAAYEGFAQGTTATEDLGPDGLSWAQAYPILVDQHDKIVLLCQRDGTGLIFVISNDGGETWADNTGHTNNGDSDSYEIALTRGSIALDTTNDIIHALHSASSGSDGVIYRRYFVNRDGSNNITSIVRDYADSINLQLELDAGISVEKPMILWLDDAAFESSFGAVVALWEVADADAVEIHGSMRVLTNGAADGVGSNWRRLDGGSTSSASQITSTKNVAISVLTPNYSSFVCPAVLRKRGGTHVGDLYLFWQVRDAADGLHFRRFPWNADNANWDPPTSVVDVADNVRAGSTTIRQLWEVLSKPAEDPVNDRVYIAFANWKSDTDGDTWSFVYIDDQDAVQGLTDVYAVGGEFDPSLYALSGDIAYDETASRVVVTHIAGDGVGTNFGYVSLYQDDGELDFGPEVFFNDEDVDIPLLWQDPASGATRLGDGLTSLVLFRDTRNQTPPYFGWAVRLTWDE